jgi:hypothetical protein
VIIVALVQGRGMMSSPKSLAESTEFSAELPPGNEERFSGYGVMGLPFASGA